MEPEIVKTGGVQIPLRQTKSLLSRFRASFFIQSEKIERMTLS
jgi:hypothetical protein